jgi:hypothetical protein
MAPRSAAQSLYPHLPSAERPEVQQQRRAPTMADAIFPAWSREAKQRDADQALSSAINKRNRQTLLRNLREAVANIERRGRNEV